MNPVLIAPSLLSADFARLGAELERIEGAGADWLHLDVMDGHFVPNLTFGPPVIGALRAHSQLTFDVHLMIENPDPTLEAYRAAGADWITVHVEAVRHLHRTVRAIRDLGAGVGVSLNPGTSEETLRYVLGDVDLVLVMSVNPGFGGQSFIPEVLPKIRRLRAAADALGKPLRIAVDGGMNATTARAVIEAGADVLVAGSFVFSAPDPRSAIQALRGIAPTP